MLSLKQSIRNLMHPRANEHEADKGLIIIIGIILLFGLVMLSSATAPIAYAKFGSTYHYFSHQLFGLALGLAGFWFFSKVDYHRWKKYAFYFLVGSIVLLFLVFIPGLSATYGKARSWIDVFGFSLQPSEFVKISFLLYLSAWLEMRGKRLHDFYEGTGPFLMVLGFIAFLMLMQPDFGTLFIIGIISLVVYYVGGAKTSHIIMIILACLIGLAILVQIKPYQMNRFKCMFNPDFSQGDICYQLNQSLIAVGSGELLGRGLGQSRQKFLYLPEVGGDAIFSVIAEEVGLIVSSILVLLYILLFYRGYLVAKQAPDDYGKIMAIGIITWIVAQAIINIGGMIALMPMTGVPLPLISYGGSAIISALCGLGILVNISKQTMLRKI